MWVSFILFQQVHSQIPDKRQVTVYKRRMFTNMKYVACCLPDLLQNHSSLVSHKALSRNPRTSIQIITKNHFHLLLNVILVNESQFYPCLLHIPWYQGSNGFWLLRLRQMKGKFLCQKQHRSSTTVTSSVTKSYTFHCINMPTDIAVKHGKATKIRTYNLSQEKYG